MRLVIDIGYQSLVFAPGAQVSGIISAFEGATICQSEGYAEAKRYVPQASSELGIHLIPDGDVSLPDVPKGAVLERLITTEAELSKVRGELYAAKEQLKKVGQVVAPEAK